MLDTASYADMRNYIKRRLSHVRYRVGSTFYRVELSDVSILYDGTVRAQASLIPGGTVTVNRVELYNNNGDLWAHQDCSITIETGQTGILYWFDFLITEEAS